MNILAWIFSCLLTFSLAISHCTEAENPSIEENKIDRFLLITGCGRSGTLYVTDLLRKCSNLRINHEKLGPDGICSWYLAVDCDNPPKGISAKRLRFTHIFHQVRNPLKMISSCTETFKARSWAFIHKCIPEISLDDPIVIRAAKYWYYWNKKAEEKAEWTYRLEDIKDLLGEFEQRLGIVIDRQSVDDISGNTNTRGETIPFTWSELETLLPAELYEAIVELAIHYGYAGPEQ